MKGFLYFIFIIFALVFIRYTVSLLFNRLYFAYFPEVFNGYVLRDDTSDRETRVMGASDSDVTNEGDQNTQNEDKPIKLITDFDENGCSNICQGKVEKVECTRYNSSVDFCELKCYGYMYNSCKSGYAGLFVMFLTE